jgi:hypothetical protein
MTTEDAVKLAKDTVANLTDGHGAQAAIVLLVGPMSADGTTAAYGVQWKGNAFLAAALVHLGEAVLTPSISAVLKAGFT